jgi:hypothetical protein
MDNDSQAKWERFLDPEVLRPNLILASVYIAAFEVLKNSIIDRLRFFYVSGFDQNGDIISPEYKDEVLAKDRSLTYASLKWLKEAKAITDEDIEKFTKARECRNLLAHEITKMLMEGLPRDFAERFNDMTALLDKIERWWIINFEIPINPDLAANIDKIDLEGIVPGPIASLKMMIDVALGSNETATYYINEFKKGMSGG